MEEILLVRIWHSPYSLYLYYSRMRYSPECAKRIETREEPWNIGSITSFVSLEMALEMGAWPEP